MHAHLLCACWHLEAMKGSSSLTSCRLPILSRLLSSLIWAQLTLLVPALGIGTPLPQNGDPIHRVRAHSLTGIRNSGRLEHPIGHLLPSSWLQLSCGCQLTVSCMYGGRRTRNMTRKRSLSGETPGGICCLSFPMRTLGLKVQKQENF